MTSVLGVIVISRNGDRYGYSQDPDTYEGVITQTTALGEDQSHALGSLLRNTYLDNSSDTRIMGMHTELANHKEVKVRIKAGSEGTVVFDSAIALLQGLFPPTTKNSIRLADGKTVMAPLGGYQYIPVETVEPDNDRSLEGWTDCPNFQKHIQKFHQSEEFKRVEESASSFFKGVKDFVFGRETSLRNMWNIYDYVSEQLLHNQTYAFRLPPTYVNRARDLANFHQNGVFSDKEHAGIGNVAGRTMMHTILSSLERIAFDGDPLQFLLIGTTYQPFISLFHQTDIVKKHPKLAAIPDYASALVIELRRGQPPDLRDFLRFRFKNGTADNFETLHVFDHREDEIPLTEFIYRAQGAAIRSNREWRQVCGASNMASGEAMSFGETVGEAVKENGFILNGILSLFFVFALFLGGMFAYKKRKQNARITLRGHENPFLVADRDAKPVFITVTEA